MKENKATYFSIIFVVILLAGVFIFTNANSPKGDGGNNISVLNGKQIITINAKGGYSPRTTNAKADMPTVIKMETNGSFDCSSALSIPSLGYRNNLPPSGETLIDVLPQKAGTKLQGICAMGMYNFTINFN
jgi:plastocyanin domain-containing protein